MTLDLQAAREAAQAFAAVDFYGIEQALHAGDVDMANAILGDLARAVNATDRAIIFAQYGKPNALSSLCGPLAELVKLAIDMHATCTSVSFHDKREAPIAAVFVLTGDTVDGFRDLIDAASDATPFAVKQAVKLLKAGKVATL